MKLGLNAKPSKFTILLAVVFGILCVYILISSIQIRKYDDCAYYKMLENDNLAKKCLQSKIATVEFIEYSTWLYFSKLEKDFELSDIHIKAIKKLNLNKRFPIKEIQKEINGSVKIIKVIDVEAYIKERSKNESK